MLLVSFGPFIRSKHNSAFLLFPLSSGQRCFGRFCQQRQCGADFKLLDQLPDRANDEQPAHPSQWEPSGRAFQVGFHTLACSALHVMIYLCSQYAPTPTIYIFLSLQNPLHPCWHTIAMERRGTSVLLWLPQRQRINWINHCNNAHVAVCISLTTGVCNSSFVLLMSLCVSRLCCTQAERMQMLLLFLPGQALPHEMELWEVWLSLIQFTCTSRLFLVSMGTMKKVFQRHNV